MAATKTKQKYLLGVVLLILGIYLGGGLVQYVHEQKKETAKKQVADDLNNTDTRVKGLYTQMSNTLYDSIPDKDFVNFAKTIIEPRCPFYVPNGITYRECLSDWEQGLEAKTLTEAVDEVHAYCTTFTKKYTDESSLEGQELFLKCAIYKLQ
ncbi:MAG: hypothetical protein WC444_01265 [Candidatus Paceibacterota bacterium]